MMTAAEYVSAIVEPTLEEFRRDRSNLRRGMLASMAVLHVVDFVMENRGGTPSAVEKAIEAFKRRAAGTLVGFDVVNKFALASKHASVKKAPGFSTDKHRITSPSFWGSFVPGRTFLGDKTGGIAVDLGKGGFANLLKCLDATMALYRTEFPEAFISEPVATPVS